LISKTIVTDFNRDDSTEDLWNLHSKLLLEYASVEKEIDQCDRIERVHRTYYFFDLKMKLARRMLLHCHLCPRYCRVNRVRGELGWCKLRGNFHISSAFLHTGEEPELVPSGTIFTIGCNLRCIHYQNLTISQQTKSGIEITPLEMAKIVERLVDAGGRKTNMVGDDPTPWLYN
jgi:putative pyruvate formate lyase activating enzyme